MPPRPTRVGSVRAGNLHPSAETQLALLDLGLCLFTDCVLATGTVVRRVLFTLLVHHTIMAPCPVSRVAGPRAVKTHGPRGEGDGGRMGRRGGELTDAVRHLASCLLRIRQRKFRQVEVEAHGEEFRLKIDPNMRVREGEESEEWNQTASSTRLSRFWRRRESLPRTENVLAAARLQESSTRETHAYKVMDK